MFASAFPQIVSSIILCFVLLIPTPAFAAKVNDAQIKSEIIENVLAPCYRSLASVAERESKRYDSKLTIDEVIRIISPPDFESTVQSLDNSLGPILKTVKRKERFKTYRFLEEVCISNGGVNVDY